MGFIFNPFTANLDSKFSLTDDCIKDTHVDWGLGANQVSATDVPIADGGDIIAATEVEGALQENRTAINLNTAKETNVPTELSAGTVNGTSYGITSDGGADDIVLPEADTDNAGLLGADKWDEIVANSLKVTNATHTGDVAGATELTIGEDKVKDTHIDWGTGANQVSASDLPILDSDSYYTGTDVETALQEVGLDLSKLNPANTVTVGSSGCDYTTIQAALDANTSGGELFLVYPGTYTDDTIAFTANNQTVRGMGCSPEKVYVTTANANICDYAAYAGCKVCNVKMTVTAATTLVHTVQGSTGSCNFYRCHAGMTTTYATAGAQPSCYYSSGAGTVKISEGTIDYNHSGAIGTGIASIKAAIFWAANVPTYDVADVNIDVDGSNSSLAITIAFGTGAIDIDVDHCHATVDDVNSNVSAGFYIGGAGSEEFHNNDLHVTGGGTNAYGVWSGGTGTVRGMYNHIHVTGATNNYSYNRVGAATIVSQFEDIIATGGVAGSAGTFEYVNSEADGDFGASGTILGGTFTDGVMSITGGVITGATNTNWDDAYTHSGLTTGNPHSVTLADVGGTTDHGNLSGLSDDDHTQYILHSLADAENDFLVASGADTYVKKTLAETGAILEGDISHDNLQSITGTAGQYNHPTDANMTVLGNTSNTNTGDQSAGDFNHDDLANISANEHIDWTTSQTPTVIHADNYTNTTYSAGDFSHGSLADLSTGADHSYIDQDVTTTGTPSFTSVDVGASVLATRSLTVDTGGVFNVAIGSASGDDFTIDTDKLVVEGDTGNVGIGTATPLLNIGTAAGDLAGANFSGLHVYSASTIAGIAIIEGANRADLWLVDDSSAADDKLAAISNLDGVIKLWSSSDAFAMRNDNIMVWDMGSGNVGIGTAEPGAKLDVAGNIQLTGSNRSLTIENTNHADYPRLKINPTSVPTNNFFLDVFAAGTATVPKQSGFRAFNSITGTDYRCIYNNINTNGIGVLGTTVSGSVTGDDADYGAIAISPRDVEKVRITTTGNVGIGTAGPGSKLHVQGGAFSIDNGSPATYAGRTNAFVLGRQDQAYANYAQYISYSGSAAAADNTINFELSTGHPTAHTTVMSLLGNGNVGIGTTAPWGPLQVNTIGTGNLQDGLIVGSLNGGGTTVGLSLGTSAANVGYIQQYLYGTGWGNLALQPSGGNVGIGTDSPDSTLEVNGGCNIGGTGAIADNDLYVDDNCSAASFTDRTPFYDGDALKELKAIKAKDGEIDHTTLPEFAQKTLTMGIRQEEKDVFIEEERVERDLGAMISILTKGVQQLTERIEVLETAIKK